jgi:hypothetical protein
MMPEFKVLDDNSPPEPGPTLTPEQEKRREIMFSRYLGLEEHLRLEAFCHAKFMIEMAVRYADVPKPPHPMPSGWAALLYLYDLR